MEGHGKFSLVKENILSDVFSINLCIDENSNKTFDLHIHHVKVLETYCLYVCLILYQTLIVRVRGSWNMH